MQHLLIYTEQPSKRLSYCLDVVIRQFLGITYSIIQNKIEFESYQGAKLAYQKETLENVPFIPKSDFFDIDDVNAFAFSIIHQDIHSLLLQPIPSVISFDLFAAVFYFISRAEEYREHTPDKHGRFTSCQSLLHLSGLAMTPVVDVWTEHLKSFLQYHFPNIQIQQPLYKPVLSFDIDIAWAYKGKPFVRHYGNYLRDMLTFNFKLLSERYAVITGKRNDPFDVYDYIETIQKQTGLDMIFFFHVRSKGKYDKAVSTLSKEFHSLVKRLSDIGTIGIHPSYTGGQEATTIQSEKHILEKIVNKPVVHSRQHYLKLHIPASFRALEKAGITEDYTMGFADGLCWRAGTTKPFSVYDMKLDRAMSLKTHPLSVMDGTLLEYMNCNPEQALLKMNELYRITQQFCGEFVSLWHNETISNSGIWKGWRDVTFDTFVTQFKHDNI